MGHLLSKNDPFYNTTICSRLHSLLFEDYVTTFIRDQYNTIFTIEDHEREHKFLSDEASSGGDRPLPLNSKKEYLI